MRDWAERLFAILFGIGAAWILMEVFLRVAYPFLPYVLQAPLREVRVTLLGEERILPQQIWQPDGEYQLVSRANVTNELQFPDPRIGFYVTTKNWLDPNSHVGFRVHSPDWEPRWPVDAVVLGDSFTFCYTEYSDCWVQRLADEYGLSVVNLGQVATGSISHLNLLRKFGLLYEPRFVIWQWHGNDFNEDYIMALKYGGLAGEEELEVTTVSCQSSAVSRWLQKYSAVYWVVRIVSSSQQELQDYTIFVDPYRMKDGNIQITFGRPATLEAFDMTRLQNQKGQELSQEAILETRDILAQRDTPLVIVLVPSKEETYRHLTEGVLGTEYIELLGEGRYQMMAFCETHNLICLDTTAALVESAERGNQVYWPEDIHLNEQGNQVLTDVVWEFLVEYGLVMGE